MERTLSTVGFGRLKRRAGDYRSGSGAGGDFLKTILRLDRAPRERAASDTALVRQALLLQLALKALDRVIAEYCGATQGRRPSYAALAQYLEQREGRPEAEPASGTGAKAEIPALLQPRARAAAA
jgi:hypothetical protein